MTEPGPARNLEAERGVLGECMMAKSSWLTAGGLLNADDFYLPAHAMIWGVIGDLYTESLPADPVLVLDRITKLGYLKQLQNGAYLITLYQAACMEPRVGYYAQLIADAATLRRLHAAGMRIAQRAEEASAEPAELVAWSAEQIASARDDRQGVDVLTSDWERFIHSTPEDRVMVVPGLLGEGDRLVLTGHGGLGKSTMLQQIAVCAAAGLPPFDWFADDPFDPVKVSIFDFENPDHRVKTRLWPMVNDCIKQGADPRDNLTVGGHGNPLNLLSPQNALSLLRTIEHDKPQLVYIGPVYKMHNDDPDKESVVKKITDVLDSIRSMGVAIITEAHHTKEGRKGGTLEPSGSNLWTWWPEFGLGLRLAAGEGNVTRRCDLERWRIDREISQWPLEVESSGQQGLVWARAAAPGWSGQVAS